MTQYSYPWSCATTGDGGPNSFSVETVETLTRLMGNGNITDSGVVFWENGTTLPLPGLVGASDELLLPQHMGGEIVRINTGVGLVQGWHYFNDNAVNFTVSGGAASAVDIIGLRRDVTAQTVRLFHGRGGAGTKYPLVQNNVIWEIPLAEVTLTAGGNYLSLKDVRRLVVSPDTQRPLIRKYSVPVLDVSGVYDFPDLPRVFSGFDIEIVGSTIYAAAPGLLATIPLSLTVNGAAAANYTYAETYWNTSSLALSSGAVTSTYWRLRLPVGRLFSSGIGISNEFHAKVSLLNGRGDSLTTKRPGGTFWVSRAYEALDARGTLIWDGAGLGDINRITLATLPSGGVNTYLSSGSEIRIYGIKN